MKAPHQSLLGHPPQQKHSKPEKIFFGLWNPPAINLLTLQNKCSLLMALIKLPLPEPLLGSVESMLGRTRHVTTLYRLCLQQALLQTGQEDSAPLAPQHLAGKHYFSFPFYCQDVPWDNLRSPCISLRFVLTALVAQFQGHVKGHIKSLEQRQIKRSILSKRLTKLFFFAVTSFLPPVLRVQLQKHSPAEQGTQHQSRKRLQTLCPRARLPANLLTLGTSQSRKASKVRMNDSHSSAWTQHSNFMPSSWTSAANVSMTPLCL